MTVELGVTIVHKRAQHYQAGSLIPQKHDKTYEDFQKTIEEKLIKRDIRFETGSFESRVVELSLISYLKEY